MGHRQQAERGRRAWWRAQIGRRQEGGAQVIGPGRVWVPSHLFKLVYDQEANRAWAHWSENSNEALAGKPITYAELVRRTGIEFLPGISPND